MVSFAKDSCARISAFVRFDRELSILLRAVVILLASVFLPNKKSRSFAEGTAFLVLLSNCASRLLRQPGCLLSKALGFAPQPHGWFAFIEKRYTQYTTFQGIVKFPANIF